MNGHVAPGFGLRQRRYEEIPEITAKTRMRGEGHGLHRAFAEHLFKGSYIFAIH